jgi:hypothetical protein
METKRKKRKESFRIIRFLLLMAISDAAGGCAVIPALLSSSAVGVEYTITNQGYKVLPASDLRVKAAVNRALGKLQFPVIKTWIKDGDVSTIRARAKNYIIVIQVERVSGGATRLEVDARHKYMRLIKDKSLAVAMITETEKNLKIVQRQALKRLVPPVPIK